MTGNSEHAADGTTLPGAEQQSPAEVSEGSAGAVSPPQDKPSLLGQLSMVCLGIVAGGVSAQLVTVTKGLFPRPAIEGMAPFPPELLAAADRAHLADTAVGFGLAGAVMAAVLGAALWLLRRSKRAALTGALTGLVAGALLGALGGLLNTLLSRQIADVEMDDLFRAMLIHAPFWICLSVAVGLAVGMPLRDVSTAKVIGATLGAAILASLLFPLLSMLLLPATRSELVIPHEFSARVLWLASGAAILAWSAARAVPSKA